MKTLERTDPLGRTWVIKPKDMTRGERRAFNKWNKKAAKEAGLTYKYCRYHEEKPDYANCAKCREDDEHEIDQDKAGDFVYEVLGYLVESVEGTEIDELPTLAAEFILAEVQDFRAGFGKTRATSAGQPEPEDSPHGLRKPNS